MDKLSGVDMVTRVTIAGGDSDGVLVMAGLVGKMFEYQITYLPTTSYLL